jgi:hypothetical protein
MQRAARASGNVVCPVQELGGRIAPAMLHQEITEFRLEVQPWILEQDCQLEPSNTAHHGSCKKRAVLKVLLKIAMWRKRI